MFYQFKAQSSDFIVEELLSAQPSGKGEVLYVYFQKEHLTTMAVLEHLQRSLPLSRENLGIAGLKDKAGITRQWITVFKSTLEKVGGETRFLSVLSELTTVLKTTWGDVPLRIGGNGGNRFEVRLRAREAVGAEKKNLIVQNAEQVKIKGFPNCFGFQRFGKGMKNFREAKEVIQGKENRGKKKEDPSYHLRFMLQAFASGWFNEYVMTRREKGLHLLGGDLVVDRHYATGANVGVYQEGMIQKFDYQKGKTLNESKGVREASELLYYSSLFYPSQWSPQRVSTGPMLGWNLLVPPVGSKARVREDQLFEVAEFDEQALAVCKEYHLRGVRRPLWARVEDLEVWFEGNDCLFRFSLSTGSYATVLLAFLLAGVDPLTLKDNRLEIPRIAENRQL